MVSSSILKPNEEVFSAVKCYLENNSLAHRHCDDPRLFVYAAFASVTKQHCQGYIMQVTSYSSHAHHDHMNSVIMFVINVSKQIFCSYNTL